jgi:hypothetical protein
MAKTPAAQAPVLAAVCNPSVGKPQAQLSSNPVSRAGPDLDDARAQGLLRDKTAAQLCQAWTRTPGTVLPGRPNHDTAVRLRLVRTSRLQLFAAA